MCHSTSCSISGSSLRAIGAIKKVFDFEMTVEWFFKRNVVSFSSGDQLDTYLIITDQFVYHGWQFYKWSFRSINKINAMTNICSEIFLFNSNSCIHALILISCLFQTWNNFLSQIIVFFQNSNLGRCGSIFSAALLVRWLHPTGLFFIFMLNFMATAEATKELKSWGKECGKNSQTSNP